MPHHLAKSVGEVLLLLLGVWVMVFGLLEARATYRNGYIPSGRAGTTQLRRRTHPRQFWATILFNGAVLPLLGAAILLAVALVHFQPRAGEEASQDTPRCQGMACWRLPKP